MYETKFTELPQPALISSIRHRTVDEAIEDIKASEDLGADGFIVHVQLMDEEYRNASKLERMFASTKKPVMALNYRKSDRVDEQRAELLLDCVKAGAAAVDMWLDMFDYDSVASLSHRDEPFTAARPLQVSMLPEAVEKQREFIGKVHAQGGEVLVSTHVGVSLGALEALSLAREVESRGADIVKIIVNCKDYEQALEVLRTDAVLKESLSKRFLYQCAGRFGAFVRLTACLFGSSYILCHASYGEMSNREKPLISDVKNVLNSIKFRL